MLRQRDSEEAEAQLHVEARTRWILLDHKRRRDGPLSLLQHNRYCIWKQEKTQTLQPYFSGSFVVHQVPAKAIDFMGGDVVPNKFGPGMNFRFV